MTDDYKVSKETVDKLFDKIEKTRDEVHTGFSDMMKTISTHALDFQGKHHNHNQELTKLTLQHEHMQSTLNTICSLLKWVAISFAIVFVSAIANFILRGGLMP